MSCWLLENRNENKFGFIVRHCQPYNPITVKWFSIWTCLYIIFTHPDVYGSDGHRDIHEEYFCSIGIGP